MAYDKKSATEILIFYTKHILHHFIYRFHQVWPPEISNYGAICLESMGYFHSATSPACIFTGNALDCVFRARWAKYSNVLHYHQDLGFPGLFTTLQIKLEMTKCLQIGVHKSMDAHKSKVLRDLRTCTFAHQVSPNNSSHKESFFFWTITVISCCLG